MASKAEVQALQAEIAKLRAENAKLRDDVAAWKDEAARRVLPERMKSGISEAFELGRKIGWDAGSFAALCPVDPSHGDAIAPFLKDGADPYVAGIVAAIRQAHTAHCNAIRKAAKP